MMEDKLCSHQTKLEVLSQKKLSGTEQLTVTHTFRGY